MTMNGFHDLDKQYKNALSSISEDESIFAPKLNSAVLPPNTPDTELRTFEKKTFNSPSKYSNFILEQRSQESKDKKRGFASLYKKDRK